MGDVSSTADAPTVTAGRSAASTPRLEVATPVQPEFAEILGVWPGSIASLVHRALGDLRKVVEP